MKKIIIIGLGLALILTGCSQLTTKKSSAQNLTVDQVRVKAADFINAVYMADSGQQVTVKEVVDEGFAYKVIVSMPNGNDITSYMTKDGKNFFPQVVDIAKEEAAAKTRQVEAVVEKSDKPKLELFVMSFCPYGVQAEEALAPVVDLLGSQADIAVRYIVSLSGDDLASVQSLHGAIEGTEDARQLCIMKNYDQKTFWQYLAALNKDCYPIYRNGEAEYNACWQKSARAAGIDTKKIDTCLKNEGADLIKTESAAADGYGVSGSPSFVLNGKKANPARTAEGIKKAICDAFNTPPSECSQTLSSEGATASGGCN